MNKRYWLALIGFTIGVIVLFALLGSLLLTPLMTQVFNATSPLPYSIPAVTPGPTPDMPLNVGFIDTPNCQTLVITGPYILVHPGYRDHLLYARQYTHDTWGIQKDDAVIAFQSRSEAENALVKIISDWSDFPRALDICRYP